MQRGSELTPKVSYLTSIDLWFTMMKVFTVLALMESILVIAWTKQSNTLVGIFYINK